MRKHLIIFSIMALTLISCEESGNGTLFRLAEDTRDRTGEALTMEKSLFSSWRNISRFQTALDFRGEDFNRSFTHNFKIDTLVSCDCFVYIAGNESTGSMRISSCFDRAGNYDRFDCQSLEGYVSYSKSHSDLRLYCVNKEICGTYR